MYVDFCGEEKGQQYNSERCTTSYIHKRKNKKKNKRKMKSIMSFLAFCLLFKTYEYKYCSKIDDDRFCVKISEK